MLTGALAMIAGDWRTDLAGAALLVGLGLWRRKWPALEAGPGAPIETRN